MNNNKNAIRIIIDSTADVADRVLERVSVVPLTVSFGDEEFLDGVDLSRDDFYRKLETGSVLPKTSQASPAAFGKVYEAVRAEGAQAIVITVSSVLSGTYQSACIAAEDYPEIRVVDSRSVAVGTGILAEYALACIDRGMGLDDLAGELEKKRDRICLLAMLDTLEYLMKGGRISRTAASAASTRVCSSCSPVTSSATRARSS